MEGTHTNHHDVPSCSTMQQTYIKKKTKTLTKVTSKLTKLSELSTLAAQSSTPDAPSLPTCTNCCKLCILMAGTGKVKGPKKCVLLGEGFQNEK